MKATITITDAPGENGDDHVHVVVDFDPPILADSDAEASPAQCLAAEIVKFLSDSRDAIGARKG